MVGNAERIIHNKLTPALKGKERQIAGKQWDEIVLALGEVAAGVAHEIRNPLTGIKGFSQLLQDRFKPEDKEWPYITHILRETERIETLVEELLMLSKPTFPRMNWVKVSSLMDELLLLLAREAVDKRVHIITDYDEKMDKIEVDVSQLKIVLFQLGKNSIDAMDKGQILRISTFQNTAAGFNEISFTKPESCLSEGEINLSTAVVKRIIENHHGILQTQNTKEGCQITIKLPI